MLYAVSALSEFKERKSQDVAKEGISIDEGTETAKVSKVFIAIIESQKVCVSTFSPLVLKVPKVY